MVWYNINIGKYGGKYTALTIEDSEYPSCDSEGNVLTKVSGKFEKGYYINEKTGEKHEKAYKLINGKASEGFKGRIKDITSPIFVEGGESEDLLVEKEMLLESPRLYEDLLSQNKEIVSAGWFGNGYKAYKIYIVPSKLYRGFCIMKCGRGQKSQIMKQIIGDLNEITNLKEKLQSVELTIQKVNKLKVEDLIKI